MGTISQLLEDWAAELLWDVHKVNPKEQIEKFGWGQIVSDLEHRRPHAPALEQGAATRKEAEGDTDSTGIPFPTPRGRGINISDNASRSFPVRFSSRS